VTDDDLVVIGAGATGLGAAPAAVRAGRRVALVQADRPGGDCTHWSLFTRIAAAQLFGRGLEPARPEGA
jgi:thioredoxin reductase